MPGGCGSYQMQVTLQYGTVNSQSIQLRNIRLYYSINGSTWQGYPNGAIAWGIEGQSNGGSFNGWYQPMDITPILYPGGSRGPYTIGRTGQWQGGYVVFWITSYGGRALIEACRNIDGLALWYRGVPPPLAGS